MFSDILFKLLISVLATVLASVLLSLLYRSKISFIRILENSRIERVLNLARSKIQSIYGRKLFELTEDELVDLLVHNPKLIDSRFQVSERNCRRTYDGLVLEPEICGRDSEDREAIVFVEKEFDVESRVGWLEMVSCHATPECRVIIATISCPDEIDKLQDRGFDHVSLQVNLVQLPLAFLAEFYYDRVSMS